MKIPRGIGACLGVLALGASAVAAQPVLAATDTTPPKLNLPTAASYVVGATLTDRNFNTPEFPAYYSSTIPMRVAWSASDASGICGYDVLQEFAGPGPSPLVTGTLATSFSAATGMDYDGSYGGGAGVKTGWFVVARDCAGNTTQKRTNTESVIYTETGASTTVDPIRVTTTGAWSRASCECWLGDAVRRSTARNASLSFRVPISGAGKRVALVTNTGPDRGAFDIFVDGVRKRTYNSYATAAVKKNSVIAWEAGLAAGTHTIKIVNKGTAGHPRVDVDALLVTR